MKLYHINIDAYLNCSSQEHAEFIAAEIEHVARVRFPGNIPTDENLPYVFDPVVERISDESYEWIFGVDPPEDNDA